MDLTVVVPVHRSEHTIGRTLDSIASSWHAVGSPAGLQAIIVIDGIVDASHGMCLEWQSGVELPVTVLVQENAGIAAARNAGWREARTKWLTFLDSDDELTPARLRCAQGPLESGSVYVGRQDLLVGEGLRVPGLPGADLGEHEQARFAFISMLIERSVLETLGGFREGLSFGDDWDLMIRLRERRIDFEYVEEDFLIRHIHGDNVSFDEETTLREYLRAIRDHVSRRNAQHRDRS